MLFFFTRRIGYKKEMGRWGEGEMGEGERRGFWEKS